MMAVPELRDVHEATNGWFEACRALCRRVLSLSTEEAFICGSFAVFFACCVDHGVFACVRGVYE
ncbi:MAG: hypothetical protein AAGA53_15975 [Pseudomonadota bacterium]